MPAPEATSRTACHERTPLRGRAVGQDGRGRRHSERGRPSRRSTVGDGCPGRQAALAGGLAGGLDRLRRFGGAWGVGSVVAKRPPLTLSAGEPVLASDSKEPGHLGGHEERVGLVRRFVVIGHGERALGRSERWTATTSAAVERPGVVVAARRARNPVQGAVFALRQFISSELLHAGLSVGSWLSDRVRARRCS